MPSLSLLFLSPKEAVVQYEQYEQEVKHLQQLIERAHCEIQDKPIATSNINELQAQISRHEVMQLRTTHNARLISTALNLKINFLTHSQEC